MPYLQLEDQQFPLSEGDVTVGAFEGAAVRLPSGDSNARAVVSVSAKGVNIRRGTPDAVVLVNGVQLGGEPSPLLHGDRVELAGHELRLGDDQKGGSTQFVSAADVANLVASGKPAAVPKKPTEATGGRLVSLVDGREYTVANAGASFGREVGNDIVLASGEVSRKHASIAPAENGYVLTDHSTNGVWVNGSRVAGTQLLGRGDVIKMGTEEFRFYADVSKAPPGATTVPSAAPVVAAESVSSAPKLVAEPPIVEPPTVPTPAPVAPAPTAAAAKPARVPFATLEIKAEGALKGTKFELHSALTNIGRGEHNDIAIRDESISDSHAKLQKRADGWWIVDQGSTNGTYVGGRRVQGEQKIEGAPDLRFGGIKMSFRPAHHAPVEGGSTRAIAAADIEALRRGAGAKTPALARQPAAPAPKQESKKSGCGSVIAFFITIAGTSIGLVAMALTTLR